MRCPKSTIKLAPDYMELIRRGSLSTHMVFETNKKNVTYYNTPFGSIPMGVDARKVSLQESEDEILAEIHYLLDMNYQHVADSTIHIEVRRREGRKGQTRDSLSVIAIVSAAIRPFLTP